MGEGRPLELRKHVFPNIPNRVVKLKLFSATPDLIAAIE